MIPVVFRTPRSLSALNVCAVGLAIAAMTTAAFIVGDSFHASWPLIVGIPSLGVGTLWAAMLRRRETIGRHNIPVGWVMSVPLAALNGALACALLFCVDAPHIASFLGGMFLGATFGVALWAPGLGLVLFLFGMPIAHARRLAKRGLAGEERGERFVGIACVVLALCAIALARGSFRANDTSAPLFYAFALLAVASGTTAAIVATKREAKRRRFVERVEADEVPGFRVEPRPHGKMLVRVEPHIETYRLAPEPDEELIELDSAGRAMRAMR